MILRQYIIDKWLRGKWHTDHKPEGYIASIARKTLESRHFDISNVAAYTQKVLKDQVDMRDLIIKLPYPSCFFEFERFFLRNVFPLSLDGSLSAGNLEEGQGEGDKNFEQLVFNDALGFAVVTPVLA